MAILDGKLHVLGGIRFKDEGGQLDQHWMLDGGKWQKRALLPEPSMTKAGAYGVVKGKLYVFQVRGALHHVYDPKTDRWSDKLPFSQGGSRCQASSRRAISFMSLAGYRVRMDRSAPCLLLM